MLRTLTLALALALSLSSWGCADASSVDRSGQDSAPPEGEGPDASLEDAAGGRPPDSSSRPPEPDVVPVPETGSDADAEPPPHDVTPDATEPHDILQVPSDAGPADDAAQGLRDAGPSDPDRDLHQEDAAPDVDPADPFTPDASDALDTSAPPDAGPTVDVGDTPDGAPPAEDFDPAVLRVTLGSTPVAQDATAPALPAQRVFVGSSHALTLTNVGSSPVVIEGLRWLGEADASPLEWSVRVTAEADARPWEAGVELAAGASVALWLRWMPARTGSRASVLAMDLRQGEARSQRRIRAVGTGQDSLFFPPGVTVTAEVGWARPTAGAAAVGGSLGVTEGGRTFVSANVVGWWDSASADLAVACLLPTGALCWQRVWSAPFRQESPDPGQNFESGGGASSLSVGPSGDVWVAGRSGVSSTLDVWRSLILRIDGTTGDLVWARSWQPEPGDVTGLRQGSQAYAVDASDAQRVFVAGTTRGELDVWVAALDASDGRPLWSMTLDPAPTYTDRAYGLRYDGQGNLWVSGVTRAQALLMRIEGADTLAPRLSWAQRINLGVGTNLVDVALDEAGHAVVAVDQRGLSTQFRFARVRPDGTVAWGRSYDVVGRTERHNTHGVQVVGDDVWVSGRIGLNGYDTSQGDGLIVRVALQTGAFRSAWFYYTGTQAIRAAMHRIKRVQVQGGRLVAMADTWVGASNRRDWAGHWYTVPDAGAGATPTPGAGRLQDSAWTETSVTDVTGETVVTLLPGAVAVEMEASPWRAAPSNVDARPLQAWEGPGSHSLVSVWWMDLAALP